MNILALDTSTELCSVALRTDKIFECEHKGARQHGAVILRMIEDVMTDAGITRDMLQGIAFTKGPGSFTGLRMTSSVTQALALVYNLPVVAISTLQLIAQRAYKETEEKNCVVIQDAHMGEVYWGCYQFDQETGLMQSVAKDQLHAPDEIQLPKGQWYGVGDAWKTHPDVFSSVINKSDRIIYPHARDLIDLSNQKFKNAETQTVAEVMPVYLRSEKAWKTVDQQGVQ